MANVSHRFAELESEYLAKLKTNTATFRDGLEFLEISKANSMRLGRRRQAEI